MENNEIEDYLHVPGLKYGKYAKTTKDFISFSVNEPIVSNSKVQ